jgi:hypothetical protein
VIRDEVFEAISAEYRANPGRLEFTQVNRWEMTVQHHGGNIILVCDELIPEIIRIAKDWLPWGLEFLRHDFWLRADYIRLRPDKRGVF